MSRQTNNLVSPWRLTPAQAEGMDLLIKLGCNKLIARAIHRTPKGVDARLSASYARMGQPNRTLAAVTWALWRAAEATASSPQP